MRTDVIQRIDYTCPQCRKSDKVALDLPMVKGKAENGEAVYGRVFEGLRCARCRHSWCVCRCGHLSHADLPPHDCPVCGVRWTHSPNAEPLGPKARGIKPDIIGATGYHV